MGLGFFDLGLPQRFAKPLVLLVGQEPFAPHFLVFLDVPAWVGAIRAKPPDFREIEHLREHAQGPVGLVGLVGKAVMDLGDIGAFDIDDLSRPDPGVDEELDRAAVFALGCRAAVCRNIVVEEALAQLFHGWRLAH